MMANLRALALLCLAGLIALAPIPGARADYYPAGAYTVFSGYNLLTTGQLVHTGPAGFGGIEGYQDTGLGLYFQVFAATAQPTTGTAAVWESSCANNTVCQMAAIPPGGIQMATGLFVALSSTGTTYTPASFGSGGFFSVAYK